MKPKTKISEPNLLNFNKSRPQSHNIYSHNEKQKLERMEICKELNFSDSRNNNVKYKKFITNNENEGYSKIMRIKNKKTEINELFKPHYAKHTVATFQKKRDELDKINNEYT